MEGGINEMSNDNNWNNNGDEILITEQQLQDSLCCYLTVFLSFDFNIEHIFYIALDTLFNLSYIFVFYFFIYFYLLYIKIFLLEMKWHYAKDKGVLITLQRTVSKNLIAYN